MPNDSSSRYSFAVEKFVNSALTNDFYIGLGVDSVGYEAKDTRLNKKVANVSSFIKRVKLSDINSAFKRNDWYEGKTFKVFDTTDPDISSSTCYNTVTNELFLCLENSSQNKFLNRNNASRSKFAPSGSNGTVIDTNDGYKWLKINYDPSPLSTNYIRIFGVEGMQNVKGFTADNSGPTAAVTSLHGASGLTYGTCCLYVKEAFVEPITGKTYSSGDILAAYKVANAWSCDHLGQLTNLQPVFKPYITGTEYGGFYNISSTSGCTPCDASYADVTPFLSFASGGSAGYSSTSTYRKNYEILSSIPSGCILNAIINDVSSISYYVSKERPELNIKVNGTLGSCKGYLKTEYIGGNYGWKVTGIELENQLSSSNITYAEAVNVVDCTGSASSGDFSNLLASIQFNLSPITKTQESYLSIMDLLRTDKISVSATITTANLQTLIPTIGATYSFSSAFLTSNIKNSSGYKFGPKIYRDFTEYLKTSTTASVEAIQGDLNSISFETVATDIVSSDISTNYLINRDTQDKKIGSDDTQFEPGKPIFSYNFAFDNVSSGQTSGTFEISRYNAYNLASGGTLFFQTQGATYGILQINGVTGSQINMSDCDVLFATDSTFNQDKNTVTLIFNI